MEAPTEGLERKFSHYRGFIFRWQHYKQLSPDWDHDHCRGCWARFAEHPHEWSGKVHTEGWITLWWSGNSVEPPLVAEGHHVMASPKLEGFQLEWFCPACFEAARDKLDFVVDAGHSQWALAGLAD